MRHDWDGPFVVASTQILALFVLRAPKSGWPLGLKCDTDNSIINGIGGIVMAGKELIRRTRKKFRLIRIFFPILTMWLLGAASATADEFQASGSDGVCPAGFELVTPADARANATEACNALGTWYIARLAGGGSMDGPGYDCKIRDTDTRALGNSLCRKVASRPKFLASDSDGVCPGGYVLASASEARENKAEACGVLGTWYIARLAGGGSMDGAGYDCKIRDTDTRGLGNSLCRLGDASQYGNQSSCVSDTLSPLENRQANTGAWVKGSVAFASRSSFSSLANGFGNEAFSEDAASAYCSGNGYDWSLPQVRVDGPTPHLDVQCCSRMTEANSSTPTNLTNFVTAAVKSSSEVDDIVEAESLADIYLLSKSLGYEIPQDQLSAIVDDQASQRSKRSLSCGGYGQSACNECAESVTVYFPFNFCCIPMKTQCVAYSPVRHCNAGLVPNSGMRDVEGDVCVFDRTIWKETKIDYTRTGPNCGGNQPVSCWQVDDQTRDRLETDTAKLNHVTVLGPDETALPTTGERFIYVYRKQDDKIVVRNYDRDQKTYMYPGNCRTQSGFGAYKCDADGITNGDYLHVRHSQLNHAPDTTPGNNWGPVWCAGEMRIENGEVCMINNASGHFKPNASCIDNVASSLKAWGVPTSEWLMSGDFDTYNTAKTCRQQKDEL